MKLSGLNHWVEIVTRVAWVLFFAWLPITSFPYFPAGFGGGTLVRPLSVYPLLVLLALAIIPRLFTRPVPKTLITLLPFILVALASGGLSLLRGIQPVMGVTVSDRVLRALITLFIGVAMYFTVVLVHRQADDLRFTLRCIYAGFGVAYAWASLQVIIIIKYIPRLFSLLSNIQCHISTRKLFNSRISGMTYEPNWFAEQICFLMLPWLLASVLTGYTVFPWRWRRLTIEWLLLGWSAVLIIFTYSRAGLANLILLSFLSIILFRTRSGSPRPIAHSVGKVWLRRLLEAALVVALLLGATYYIGTRNAFFARLWSYWQENSQTSLARYLDYIGFGARMAYGQASYNTYAAYPWLGVGPGNYAFYFEQMIPDIPLARSPEVLRIIAPEEGRNRLITSKNFYLRILSETGLVGAAAFLAFLVAILGCTLYLWLSANEVQRFWGTASILGMIVFAISAFTFDSFALPNMWVVFGMSTAAAWVTNRQANNLDVPGTGNKAV